MGTRSEDTYLVCQEDHLEKGRGIFSFTFIFLCDEGLGACGWAEPDRHSLGISLLHITKSEEARAGSHSAVKLAHFGTRKGWGHSHLL